MAREDKYDIRFYDQQGKCLAIVWAPPGHPIPHTTGVRVYIADNYNIHGWVTQIEYTFREGMPTISIWLRDVTKGKFPT